jgi:hypothetical protein
VIPVVGTYVGTAIGSFLGSAIGSALGDLLGGGSEPPPPPQAHAEAAFSDGAFEITDTGDAHGGNGRELMLAVEGAGDQGKALADLKQVRLDSYSDTFEAATLHLPDGGTWNLQDLIDTADVAIGEGPVDVGAALAARYDADASTTEVASPDADTVTTGAGEQTLVGLAGAATAGSSEVQAGQTGSGPGAGRSVSKTRRPTCVAANRPVNLWENQGRPRPRYGSRAPYHSPPAHRTRARRARPCDRPRAPHSHGHATLARALAPVNDERLAVSAPRATRQRTRDRACAAACGAPCVVRAEVVWMAASAIDEVRPNGRRRV